MVLVLYTSANLHGANNEAYHTVLYLLRGRPDIWQASLFAPCKFALVYKQSSTINV